MAFPKDTSRIITNLTRPKLLSVIKAIKNKQVKWLHSSLHSESCLATFEYNRIKYEMTECWEEVTSIRRKHG